MSIKLRLVDNDYVICAKTEAASNGTDQWFRDFLKSVREELLPGQTARLAIEGSNMAPMNFEISHSEWPG